VGPRPFREGERLYGRDREIKELLDILLAERIVLCHSPSGAGKTSLIQSLVIPQVQDRLDCVVYGPTRVGSAPLEGTANRYVASALLGWEKLRSGVSESVDVPRASLSEYLLQRAEHHEPGTLELLIFDQFEEILTVEPRDTAEKLEFFRQLGTALRPRHRWALFAIRDEYVAALDPYLHLVPTRLSQRYPLGLLGLAGARQAIQCPAGIAGVPFTSEALDKLVSELSRIPGVGSEDVYAGRDVEPLHLQVVCTRVWSNLPAGVSEIGPALIEKAGGVEESLEEYYNQVVQRVSAETDIREHKIRLWFERELLDGNVRAQVAAGSEVRHGLTVEVLDCLVDAYLVRREERRSTVWYELAHDRLIVPVRTANRQWLQSNPLYRRALDWDEHRNRWLLLLGPLNYLRLKRKGLGTPLEEQFLAASRIWIGALVISIAGLCFLGWSAWRYDQNMKESFWRGAWERLDLQHELVSRTYFETVPEPVPFEEFRQGGFPSTTERPVPIEPSNKDNIDAAEKASALSLFDSSRTTIAARSLTKVEVRNGLLPEPVRDTFLDRGYPFSQSPGTESRIPNAITFDPSIPIEVVREVAYAMQAFGYPIHRIRTFRMPESDGNTADDQYSRNRSVIELSYVDELREWPPLTVEQIRRLSLPPVETT
jgi:hypothetical protein